MEAQFLVAAILLTFLSTCAESLEFVPTNAVLPHSSSSHAVVCDGEDSIYTIGGPSGKVVRYSIESREVDIVGEFVEVVNGAAAMQGDEILYFGGKILDPESDSEVGPSRAVWRYSTRTNEYHLDSRIRLPVAMQNMALAWDPVSEVGYFIGGTGEGGVPLDGIYRFDARTNEYKKEDITMLYGVLLAAGVWDTERGTFLSIGGSMTTGPWHGALHYDPETEELTKFPEALHHEVGSPCAVYSESDDAIYVLGGLRGFIRLDPGILRSETIYLTGWPRLPIAPCVYAPKWGRVYILGGYGTYNDGEPDQHRSNISYVALAPLDIPTLVTVATLPTGLTSGAAVFDGQDSIYIVGGDRKGGNGAERTEQVLRYSLEAQTVKVDGLFEPLANGAVIFHGEEIIYFGGYRTFQWTNGIYSYNTVDRNYSFVDRLPVHPNDRISVAWNAEGKIAYVFGGSDPQDFSTHVVVCYNASIAGGNMAVVAEIDKPTTNSAAIWDAQQGVAFTFGDGQPAPPGYDVLQFGPNNDIVKLDVRLPHRVNMACVVYADNAYEKSYTFVIGSADHIGGPIEFDTTRHEFETTHVQGWPDVLRSSSCAYVPKLERLYIIGGYRDNSADFSNEISYVQLAGPAAEPSPVTSTESPSSTTTEPSPTASTESPSSTTTEPPPTSSVTDPDPAASTSPDPEPSSTHSDTDEPGDGAIAVLLYTLIGVGSLVAVAVVAGVYVCWYRGRTRNTKRNTRINLGHGIRVAIQVLTESEVKEFHQGKQTGSGNQRPRPKGDDPPEDDIVIDTLAYNPAFEVAKEDLIIDLTKKLGTGHYGVVFMGHVNQKPGADLIPIAVKTIRSNALVEYFKALMSELKILAHIGHHVNIANLVGAYSGNIMNGELYVGVEFCKMSLLQHLKDQANGYIELMGSSALVQGAGDYEGPLATDLPRWAAEIAAGMEFLSLKRIVHGDLAARNVLLSFERHAKICDFGLARQLVDYTYIKSHPDNLPWKWMAIESLTDMQFSTKSDVWAYGVTLWEIFSLGKPPFPWARWNVDFLKQLWAGHRLAKPDYANEAIYNKMLECWSGKREDRPTFGDLTLFFQGETVKCVNERSETMN